MRSVFLPHFQYPLFERMLTAAETPLDMSSQIDQLPVEVLTYIFSYLRHADLANLALATKSFRRLATPLLWTHIELHRPGWHEYFRHDGASQTAANCRKDGSRKYIQLPDDESYCSTLIEYEPPMDTYRHYYLRDQRFARFFGSFNEVSYPTDLGQLSSQVPFRHLKSLCLDIDLNLLLERDEGLTLDFWAIFSTFQNLESFELIVDWVYSPQEWDRREQRFSELESTLPPWTKLHKLCLRGYIPKSFARWAISRPERLTTLELSILDRPIGNNLHTPRLNPPPEEESCRNSSEDTEDEGGEVQWAEEDLGNDSDDDDLDGEAVGPRALAILADTEIPYKMEALSTLVLTRPVQSLMRESGDPYTPYRDPICCSIRSDKAILQEWIRLIRATRRTLEHLVIDQRPYCEDTEGECTNQTEFLELYPFGSGFQRFKEMVIPVLLEDVEWPALKSLQFYGFDVPEPRKTKPHPRVPRLWPSLETKLKNSFLPAVKERFEPLGVEVDSFLGRRMVFRDDDGVISSGDGLGGYCEHCDVD